MRAAPYFFFIYLNVTIYKVRLYKHAKQQMISHIVMSKDDSILLPTYIYDCILKYTFVLIKIRTRQGKLQVARVLLL